MGSRVLRLSCGAWAWLFLAMWDLPGPGIEPMFPALAGGFLTTGPPGKYLPFKFASLDYDKPQPHRENYI